MLRDEALPGFALVAPEGAQTASAWAALHPFSGLGLADYRRAGFESGLLLLFRHGRSNARSIAMVERTSTGASRLYRQVVELSRPGSTSTIPTGFGPAVEFVYRTPGLVDTPFDRATIVFRSGNVVGLITAPVAPAELRRVTGQLFRLAAAG